MRNILVCLGLAFAGCTSSGGGDADADVDADVDGPGGTLRDYCEHLVDMCQPGGGETAISTCMDQNGGISQDCIDCKLGIMTCEDLRQCDGLCA